MGHARMIAPDRDCALCPRLVALRGALRGQHPDWPNAPVPSFGPLDARLLIAGLAPGLQGANRTGRPFTGDWAGALTLLEQQKPALDKETYKRQRAVLLTAHALAVEDTDRDAAKRRLDQFGKADEFRWHVLNQVEQCEQRGLLVQYLNKIAGT